MKFLGNLLIVAALSRSAAWAQDSLHVTALGSVPGHSDWLQYVAVEDSMLYAAEDTAGLWIINFARPNAPFETGFFDNGGYVQSVDVEGNFAYVVNELSFQVLDVSNPQMPVALGSCDLFDGGLPWNVTVRGHYAYVSDLLQGFWVIDVSDPTTPTEVGIWPGVFGTWDLKLVGDYAYVAEDMAGLYILDISDPLQPMVTGSCPPWGFGIDWSVDVAGDYAYVCDAIGMQIINVSNPQMPTQVNHLNTASLMSDAIVAGGYLFVADGYAGLRIMDLANPESPVLVGYYNTPGNALGIAVEGCVACVADSSAVRFYDVSHFIPCAPPRAPQRLAMQIPPGDGVVRLRWRPVLTDTTDHPIDITRYIVYRSLTPEIMPWDSIGSPVPPDTTFFIDSTATEERGFYQVRAVFE